METAAAACEGDPKAADAHATLLLRYGAGASFEEKAAFLTEQLEELEHVKEWKSAVKSELAKPEYSVDHLQSARLLSPLENPLLYCVLEKMGLVASLKRSIIDLHCAAVMAAMAAMAASAKQSKQEEAFLIPEMRNSHGCTLDVVLSARENWETITREEMLRFASETGRPLVAPVAPSSASSSMQTSTQTATAAPDDAPVESSSEPISKPQKPSTSRFLYDGSRNDLLHALQAIKPSNRTADATAQTQEGHVMYTAPLTYLFNEPVEIYYVFREMYIRYWSKLNAIRTDKAHRALERFDGLPPDQHRHPTAGHRVPVDPGGFLGSAGDQPGALALGPSGWLRFAGADRDFAAALFHFRAEELEAAASMDDIDEVFAELIEIQVVPILQEYLFLLS